MDEALEREIDAVGRSLVFERARMLGWSPRDAVPMFVWRGIVDDLKNGRPLGMPPQRLDEAVLGFRLF